MHIPTLPWLVAVLIEDVPKKLLCQIYDFKWISLARITLCISLYRCLAIKFHQHCNEELQISAKTYQWFFENLCMADILCIRPSRAGHQASRGRHQLQHDRRISVPGNNGNEFIIGSCKQPRRRATCGRSQRMWQAMGIIYPQVLGYHHWTVGIRGWLSFRIRHSQAMGIIGHQQVSGDGPRHWAAGTRRWPALGL